MNFKVAKDAQGHIIGCGPNTESYQPFIPVGGTLEFSDTFQQVFVTPEQIAKEARSAAVKIEAEADTFIDKLRDATPTQIQTFVNANVTDLASARTFISKLAIAVAYALQGGRDK